MKKTIKIYLDEQTNKNLKQKANALFTGRGSVTRYIEKIANEEIVFLDDNVKAVLGILQLSPNLVPKT